METFKRNLNIYIPSASYETAIGAIIPILTLWLLAQGVNYTLTALIVGLLGVGQVVGDIPAGALVAKYGEKRVMVIGALISMVAMSVFYFNSSVGVFAILILLLGTINAVFMLSRQSYLSKATSPELLGRTMNVLGLSHRFGLVLGPVLAGFVVTHFELKDVYLLALVFVVIAILVLLFTKDIASIGASEETKYKVILQENKENLQLYGSFAFLVSSLRASRQVLIPLWCSHIGLAPDTTTFIFGYSVAVEIGIGLFAGRITDKIGIPKIGLIAISFMTVALIVMPLCSIQGLTIFDVTLLGIGNGLSTGFLMSIGALIAPPAYTSKFLGVYRIFTDTGNGIGPVIVSVGNLISLPVSAVVSSVCGVVSIWLLRKFE
jgi:MFS family permease